MAQEHHPKTLQTFNDIAAVKPPCPSSSSFKIKTIVQAYVLRHVSHVVQALSNATSMVMELLKRKSTTTITNYSIRLRKKNKKKKQLFSSFRMHYNWCSSYVTPMPQPFEASFDMNHAAYYDSTWNSVIITDPDANQADIMDQHQQQQQQQLSGYLNWLEEKSCEPLDQAEDDAASEIDRLAETFIARCHEKFRLEKQESYRRYQEMLDRSV